MSNDVLVIAEHADSVLTDATHELVGAARALADAWEGQVVAVLVGNAALASELSGADLVVTVDADDLSKMAAVLEEHRGEIAAVITEPVQGAAGVWPPHDGYLEGLRDLCDAHGAYLIFDEVITGFGRLGSWFAAQRKRFPMRVESSGEYSMARTAAGFARVRPSRWYCSPWGSPLWRLSRASTSGPGGAR